MPVDAASCRKMTCRAFADAEVTMRKKALAFVTVVLIAVGIGTWATLRYLAAKPDTVATGLVSTPSKMSPLEIMNERGKDLPAASARNQPAP
jgi:pimeloyl-ACP methyl ester carboxylesterase